MSTLIITGNAGGGKSTLLNQLQQSGIHTISADAINTQLRDLSRFINRQISDIVHHHDKKSQQKIDNNYLRDLLFHNPAFKKHLEHLLHPIIFQNIALQHAVSTQHLPFIAIEIPLYFESAFRLPFADHIIIITADAHTRSNRLSRRPHIDKTAAKNLMKNQIPDTKKFTHCNDIVINNQNELTYTRILEDLSHHLHRNHLHD